MQHIQNLNQQGFNIPYIAKSRPKIKVKWVCYSLSVTYILQNALFMQIYTF